MKIINAQGGVPQAVAHLRSGGVLVYPTESSYGIGCKASDVVAVGNVFALKERTVDKTVLILVPDVQTAKQVVHWTDDHQRLADEHWPGPLTIVAKATAQGQKLAPGVVGNGHTVALRVSPHPVAAALTEAVGPLVSTSANKAGDPPSYNMQSIQQWLGKDDDVLVLDAGELKENKPSTVVAIEGGFCRVLREGPVVPKGCE